MLRAVRRLPTLALLCSVLLVAVGCQTSPRVVPAPPLQPTSIAMTPGRIAPAGAWTTPSVPQRSLVRDVAAGATPGVGDAVERRLEQGNAPAGTWRTFATLSSTYRFASDLETSGEGPTAWGNDVRLAFEKQLDFHGVLGAFLGYAHQHYDWSGPNGLIAGTDEPFANVHTLRAGVNLFQPLSESFAAVVSFSASVSAADGADLADGFSWSATAGGGYRFSKQLDAGAGVLVSNTFGDGLFVIGGPQFTWRPTEQWEIALQGAELDVAYRPVPAWELGLGALFDGARFRLPEDAPGDRPGGIVGESRLPVFLRLRYRGSKKVDVELRAGYDVWRYFTVEDRNGHAEYSVEQDPAPFVALRAIVRL